MKKFLVVLLIFNFLVMPAYSQIVDTFVETSLSKSLKIKEPTANKQVFITDSAQSVPVAVKIKKNLTTKEQREEGEYVEFETISDVSVNNINYPKGTAVEGRIETVSMNTSMGVPADIVISNFKMKKTPLQGELKKIGANRSLWVYPCVYTGSIFFGAGLLLTPIRGGHAKIGSDEIFTLYLQQ